MFGPIVYLYAVPVYRPRPQTATAGLRDPVKMVTSNEQSTDEKINTTRVEELSVTRVV